MTAPDLEAAARWLDARRSDARLGLDAIAELNTAVRRARGIDRHAFVVHPDKPESEACYALAVTLLRDYRYAGDAARAIRCAVTHGLPRLYAEDLLDLFARRQRRDGALCHLPLSALGAPDAWRLLHLPVTISYVHAAADLFACLSHYTPPEEGSIP